MTPTPFLISEPPRSNARAAFSFPQGSSVVLSGSFASRLLALLLQSQ